MSLHEQTFTQPDRTYNTSGRVKANISQYEIYHVISNYFPSHLYFPFLKRLSLRNPRPEPYHNDHDRHESIEASLPTHFCQKQIRLAALILFALFLIPGILIASENKHPSDVSKTHFIAYNKSRNTLSVKFLNSDIADVAKSLSQRTGIKILLDKSIRQPISSEFRDMPLELGIKRLLGSVSSAFVFTKEKGASGEDRFRLDTVRIFQSGNMLGANFAEFDPASSDKNQMAFGGNVSESETKSGKPRTTGKNKKSRAASHQRFGYHRQHPGAYGAKQREIMLAKQNLDMLHSKNKAETDAANHKIMELKAQLFKNTSPDQRPALMRALHQAEQELAKIRTVNSQLIMDEERNLRELNQEGASLERQKKFAETQTELENLLNGQGQGQRPLRERTGNFRERR